jgi:hypothetical protein
MGIEPTSKVWEAGNKNPKTLELVAFGNFRSASERRAGLGGLTFCVEGRRSPPESEKPPSLRLRPRTRHQKMEGLLGVSRHLRLVRIDANSCRSESAANS